MLIEKVINTYRAAGGLINVFQETGVDDKGILWVWYIQTRVTPEGTEHRMEYGWHKMWGEDE